MLATTKPVQEETMRAPRLVLSPLAPSYAPALFELLNDWEVVRMLSEVPWPLGYEDVAAFLATMPSALTDDFAIMHASAPIGVASVKKVGSGEPPRTMPRLGYWIGRKFWRRGYGTEAIGSLVDHAFRTSEAERIGAGVFHDNATSRRLLEKLGFFVQGKGSTPSRSRGAVVETVDMQLSRAAWEGR